MIHLQSLQVRKIPATGNYPFSFPFLQTLQELHFSTSVTLLVGENATGKSTLLESLACAAEMIVEGSQSTSMDKSLDHARELSKYFKLSRTKKTAGISSCAQKIFRVCQTS
jgi:predicted ATPase